MNIEHFRKLLLDKQTELEGSLGTLEGQGRGFAEAEVRDPADEATASQAAAESFDEGTVLSRTLEQVRDALERIKNGTYGTCAAGGHQIEPVRLEAIPWTTYCLQHQKKRDANAN
jgi:DnaK suppressor protein